MRSQTDMLALIAALTTSLCSVPAYAQAIGQAPDDGISWIRVIVSVILCLVLAVAAALVLRARMSGILPAAVTTGRRLRVVERLRLSPQVTVTLLSCDGGEFLIVHSPTTLLTMDKVTAVAPAEAGAQQG